MKRPIVTWFRNGHEHSLHYFKYGLMQMAEVGEIRYREMPNDQAADLLPPALCKHSHRRTVLIQVRSGAATKTALLDGEDSLFQTCELLEFVDRYYSCSFNRRFFEGQPFDLALNWQSEAEVGYYRDLYQVLQERFRDHLDKGRPLMPIGPNMEMEKVQSPLEKKLGGMRHKLSKLRAPWLDWKPQYDGFQRRWSYLLGLRDSPITSDVVLKDSLWGWPRHRVQLHQKLASLSEDYAIHSELHYRKAEAYELGGSSPPNPESFPMIVGGGVQGNYEESLAGSGLGVFATGFHYGCRNIVTLCWMLGVRTLCDPLFYESIYDHHKLQPIWHRSGDWNEVKSAIEEAKAEPAGARVQRQKTFDAIASPKGAAEYLLADLLGR